MVVRGRRRVCDDGGREMRVIAVVGDRALLREVGENSKGLMSRNDHENRAPKSIVYSIRLRCFLLL